MKPAIHSFHLTALSVLACCYNGAFGGGNYPVFRLQPVQPQSDPPSTYPPGTIINGAEIILGSVPARVWLEIHISNWAPKEIRVVQAGISATGQEHDGRGYAGSSATCMGEPGNGGNLKPALVPCGGTCLNDSSISCLSNQACRTCEGGTHHGVPCAFSDQCPGGACPPSTGRICLEPHDACRVLSGPACQIGEAATCILFDGLVPNGIPAGHYCAPGFQNKCHSAWILLDQEDGLSAIDLSTPNYRLGVLLDEGISEIFETTYLGTVVLDVPSNAKGTYTIDFDEHTFVNYTGPLGSQPNPILLQEAMITVPCGRCCYDLGGEDAQCVDHVSANECAAYGVGAVFQANEVCPEQGGPACPECGLDEHCDDGQYCNGVEVCEANSCGPGTPPCEPYEECEEATDSCSPRIPAVSTWGLVILGLLLLLIAKLRRKVFEEGTS